MSSDIKIWIYNWIRYSTKISLEILIVHFEDFCKLLNFWEFGEFWNFQLCRVSRSFWYVFLAFFYLWGAWCICKSYLNLQFDRPRLFGLFLNIVLLSVCIWTIKNMFLVDFSGLGKWQSDAMWKGVFFFK